MKKTVKINIGGSFFHFDEDACQRLIQYLKSLKDRFNGSPEGQEVVKDIEFRIAELLTLKLSETKQVISLIDINDIIDIMGRPEDLVDDEATYDNGDDFPNKAPKTNKRFYRNVDQAFVGGVCSGLAAHFNISVILIRILFVVFAIPLFGFTIVLYLILWAAMPGAYTTAEKAAMRGGDYNISDIESSVKEEFGKVKDNIENIKTSQEYHNTKRAVGQAGNAFLNTFGYLGRLIMFAIGLVMVIVGVGMLISFMGVAVFSETIFFWNGFDAQHLTPDFLYSFMGNNSLWIVSICVTILIGAPLIAIIYWGLKMILRFKANDKVISLIGTSLWIISLIFLIFVGLFEARDLAFSTKADQSETIHIPSGKTLYLESAEDFYAFDEIRVFDEGLEIYTHSDYDERVYFSPDFNIEYTNSNDIVLKIEKEARGATNQNARRNASEINYNWNLEDSILYIDPFFFHEGKRKWAFSKVEVTLLLPRHQKIHIDDNLHETINDIETSGNLWSDGIYGKTWVMTRYGLDYID